jgi:Flp pilus assembly protein TadD
MGSYDVALEFLREGQRHHFAEPPNDLAAEKAFRSATLAAPEWGEPYHWLGIVLESRGRTKDAVEAGYRLARLFVEILRRASTHVGLACLARQHGACAEREVESC